MYACLRNQADVKATLMIPRVQFSYPFQSCPNTNISARWITNVEWDITLQIPIIYTEKLSVEKEHNFLSHFETSNMHDMQFLNTFSSAPSSAPVVNSSSSSRPLHTSICVCGWIRGKSAMYVWGGWCRDHRNH